MEEKQKTMRDFYQGVKMGTESFDVFLQEAQDVKLVALIRETIGLFQKHEGKIENIMGDAGYDTDYDLKKSQEIALMMEKMTIKKKDDFELSLEIINAVEMGMVKALDFLHRNKEKMSPIFLHAGTDVINDYDNIISKFQSYAVNNL